MENFIDLNPTQIDLLNQYQGQTKAAEMELRHSQDKMNSFVSGLVSAKGYTGNLKYDYNGKQIILTLPDEPDPMPEG